MSMPDTPGVELDLLQEDLEIAMGRIDALAAEAAKWQELYLGACDELATLTAELEPWRDMARVLMAGDDEYMIYGLNYDPDVDESRRWCLTLIHWVYGTTTDGHGATLPVAVNAAYKVVSDDS